MKNIQEKIEQLKARFNRHKDWEDRYKELIVIGKNLSEMSEELKIEKFRIRGCQSQVWLYPSYDQGVITFQADSDAVLVRGIVGCLVEVYSGEKPSVILQTPAEFLKEVGITEHLSMNRTNGLANMIKQIQMYAMAFKTLEDKGINHVPAI